MIKSVQNRLKDKGINLIVELSVQAFLTDEGYDPIYGARPLRRAIMKYLEDTLSRTMFIKNFISEYKNSCSSKKS
jgi:ATP-dependent Clp protease ATP-binding subunit ClpC